MSSKNLSKKRRAFLEKEITAAIDEYDSYEQLLNSINWSSEEVRAEVELDYILDFFFPISSRIQLLAGELYSDKIILNDHFLIKYLGGIWQNEHNQLVIRKSKYKTDNPKRKIDKVALSWIIPTSGKIAWTTGGALATALVLLATKAICKPYDATIQHQLLLTAAEAFQSEAFSTVKRLGPTRKIIGKTAAGKIFTATVN